jgi:hypothetical protein
MKKQRLNIEEDKLWLGEDKLYQDTLFPRSESMIFITNNYPSKYLHG